MRHYLFCLAILGTLTASAITRSELASYAKSLKGLKKAELKTKIHELTGSPATLNYGSGSQCTWWGFYYTDRDEETNECINRYSAKKFYFPATNKGGIVSGMNIEHSFPKSWWGGSKNNAYKDLYNLYPSDTQANSSKSNYPMGVVETVKEASEGYDKVGKGTIDGVKGQNCWEPGNQYKGDFARAYMYMATAYQNLSWSGTQGLQQLVKGSWPTLKPWAYTLYLKWIKSDPVDELEVKRNNAVAKIQGNRNLYVDFPNLAEYVWGDSTDVGFDPYTAVTTATDDSRYTGTPIDVDDDDDIPVTPGGDTPGGDTPGGDTPEYDTSDILFAETFDKCQGTGGNDGKFSGSIASADFDADCPDWQASAKYGGDQCARFGSSKNTGVVTTPTFTISGKTVLTFMAAPFSSDGTTLTLEVNGNGTLSQTTLTMETSRWTDYALTLTGEGEVSITFTPQKRMFLDEVKVCRVVETLPGDIDDDGELTEADVAILSRIVLGIADKDDYNAEAADLDKDGELTIADITAIINLLLSK